MKNKGALFQLFLANTVSGFAQGVTMMAIPWYLVNKLDKESLMGSMYALITFSTLFWGMYSGTLIDRHNRKKLFLIVNIAGGIILGLGSLLGFVYGKVPISMMIIIFASTMFIYNVHYPNLYAFGQEIFEPQFYGRINSWIEVQGQFTSMIGAAVGSFLIGGWEGQPIRLPFGNIEIPFPVKIQAWDLHKIFLLDSSTYFLAFIIIFFIRYVPHYIRTIETGTVWNRLITGYNYLRNDIPLLIFGTCSFCIFVAIMVDSYFVFPMYVSNHLHNRVNVVAYAELFFAAGALLSGVFIRRFTSSFQTVSSIIVLLFIACVCFYIPAMTRSAFIVIMLSLVIGFTNGGARILRLTYILHVVPNDVIGRVGSNFQVINVLLRTFFIAVFSLAFFSHGSNVTYAYWILGTFEVLAAVILLMKYPIFKHIQHK